MSLHHIQEASFELPEGLKDRTVHRFPLSDNGPSDFTLTVSHAEGLKETTVAAFAERLLRELAKALPRFELKQQVERMVDGEPAMELDYTWRRDGTFMHQRQVAVLLPDDDPSRRALMLTGTAPKTISEAWHARFDAVIDSTRLRRVEPEPSPRPTLLTDTPHVFALHAPTRVLHVHPDASTAAGAINGLEVAEHQWVFFDSRGEPMEAKFLTRNRLGLLRSKEGQYELHTAPDAAGGPLKNRLDGVRSVEGLAPLDTKEAIARHLGVSGASAPSGEA